MAIYKQQGSNNWWYKFTWSGRSIRESTKQANKRVAEQMEATHKASLAKGEVGLREKPTAPTLLEFAEQDFTPYVDARFANKPKTLEYYRYGIKNLTAFAALARTPLDAITSDKIAAFVSRRRAAGLQVTSINRQLEVLRRMLKLAQQWGKVTTAACTVEMLTGENHRERVLSEDDQARYLEATVGIAKEIEDAYQRALNGTKAARGKTPIEPEDPYLLRDVTTILLDCALRPEECFRLQWADVRDGALNVLFGKTANARRLIPLTPRSPALLEMRRNNGAKGWVFPAPTQSGHIEKSTLKKPHKKAYALAKVEPFTLYTFRHTCLTRWAEVMDPYTLAYLAGHTDFSTTKR